MLEFSKKVQTVNLTVGIYVKSKMNKTFNKQVKDEDIHFINK